MSTVVVVGAGPGVSGSLAKRYAREGYDVGLVAREVPALEALAEEIRSLGANVGWAPADVSDPEALGQAVTRLAEHTGRVDVLHVNPSAFRAKNPLELSAAELLEDVAVGVGALLTAVQAARPFFRTGSRVTATGSVAADRPSPDVASLGVQKAALRNLVHSLDRTLAPDGIRAVSVTVEGVLDRDDPSSAYHPDQVAEALFVAAHQDEAAWRSEVRHRG